MLIGERDFSKDKRDNMDLADFGDPEKRAFPVLNQDDLDNAARLLGHADNPAAVKKRLIAIAKRKGLSLPDSWKDDKTEESFRPAPKIATVPVCWLKYNARSANGRIYPKATCDVIFEAALRQLSNANGAAITCFISHETANGNVNTALVGAVPRIWQEHDEFWANIDFADTTTSRDMLGLMENKALRAVSMRVLGVELKQDPNYDMPVVVIPEGIEPQLMGIDLTTRPGLVDVARIGQLLYESQQPPAIHAESFALDETISITKETPMTIPLYLQILTEAITPDREAHGRIHDHLAGVLDDTVKPVHGEESARFMTGVHLSEEGRALAMKHATRLAAAHDESARAMGMTCEGAYNEALGIAQPDNDQDGDNPAKDLDKDGESARGGNNLMTEEEALALLRDKYDIAPKKTDLQLLTEQVEEQKRQIAALLEQRTVPPQRQTLSLSQMTELQGDTYQPEPMYANGQFLKGPLHPKHWNALSGHGTSQLRDVPWPKDVDPWAAVHEMAPIVALGICEQQARMINSDVSFFIKPDEEV